MKEKTKNITLRIDEKLYLSIVKIAKSEMRSINSQINKFLKEELKKGD